MNNEHRVLRFDHPFQDGVDQVSKEDESDYAYQIHQENREDSEMKDISHHLKYVNNNDPLAKVEGELREVEAEIKKIMMPLDRLEKKRKTLIHRIEELKNHESMQAADRVHSMEKKDSDLTPRQQFIRDSKQLYTDTKEGNGPRMKSDEREVESSSQGKATPRENMLESMSDMWRK